MILDFGNGIATDDVTSGIGEPSTGLDVPEFEVPVNENAVFDGGSIGGSRTKCRRMVIQVIHEKVWTRRQIMRAFTPGKERVISSALGSMPYFVEDLIFPLNMEEAEREFTVVIVSPLAYPRGGVLTSEGQPYMLHTVYSHAGDSYARKVPAYEGNMAMVFQPVTVPAGQRIIEAGIRFRRLVSSTVPVTIAIHPLDGVNPVVDIVYAQVTRGLTQLIQRPLVFPNYDLAADGFAISAKYDRDLASPYRDNTGGYSGPKGRYRTPTGLGSGDGSGSPVDYDFRAVMASETSATTTVSVNPDSDVPTPPRIRLKLGSSTSTLTISDGVRTATINGSMAANDVVVLDTSDYSVTVNDVDRIAWFDRDGDWPMLDSDTGLITTSVAGELSVTWRPRLMGLL